MKPEEGLSAKWSKRENDLIFSYPRKCDGHLLHNTFSSTTHHPLPFPNGSWDPSFLDELEKRGYDIKTLKFSIKLKPVITQEVN